jgi:hemerythrin-like metal-binding protein
MTETAVGTADLEAEHALQYRLLAEAERLLVAKDLDGARDVVRQLHEYSEAHFGSEQVIMRLHAYPGYQAHEREHGELLAALDTLSGGIDGGNAASTASALRRWLTAHIHHADQAFLEYLKTT